VRLVVSLLVRKGDDLDSPMGCLLRATVACGSGSGSSFCGIHFPAASRCARSGGSLPAIVFLDGGGGQLLGVFLFLRWQKEENGRHKKGVSLLHLQECWPPFSGLLFSSLLLGVCLCTPSVCMCGLLYEASYRFEVENLDYTRLLDDQIVFQRACNLMMYSAMV